jgi:hypothetical protein
MKSIALAVLSALVFTGCVTQKIDWAARVGNYTCDQAVIEFGPPDKFAKLTDGTVVAQWLTQRAHTIIAPEPYFLPPGCYFGPLIPTYTETYVPDSYLQLTFDTGGKLKTWKKITR